MAIQIEKLFTKNRFLSSSNLLILTLYAPMGIILLIVRVFISLQLCLASLILPTGSLTRKFVLRVLYSVMGIVVRERNFEKKDEKCRLLISNHISPFDHLAVSIVYPCVTVSVYNLPGPLSSLLCYHNFVVSQAREVLRPNIKSYLNKPNSMPFLLHPEGATTNGNVALLKYGSWALDAEDSVLVIALKVHRLPLLQIAPSVLGGSFVADLFYLLFSPVTVFSVRYIGRMTRLETESCEEFASRIQSATASSLNIQVSNHTAGDKLEFVKRLSREETAVSNPFFNAEVQSMAMQVKDVLPYLPLDIINRDLLRTRNVDATITNFLEGNIPEPIPIAYSHATASVSSSAAISSVSSIQNATAYSDITYSPRGGAVDSRELNMAARNFGKSATERMQSFEERKRQLLDKARQCYMLKHCLTSPPC